MGKTLRNILLAVPLVVLTGLAGCEKQENPPLDKTPPGIKIISPQEQATYIRQETVEVKYEIKDENGDLKDAWISFNDGGRIPLYEKEGSIKRHFKQHKNKIIIGAEDVYGNASKDSTSFYAVDILTP
jgi:hypothetical protein